MSVSARPHRVRIALARLRHQISIPGLVGLALLSLALTQGGLAWKEHELFKTGREVAPASAEPIQVVRVSGAKPATLPSAEDIPVFLTRIERAALEQGLGWPRAEYRFHPSSDEVLASVEVQCTLKGPYPNVRRFVTALLQGAPTLTLREFNLSRPSASAADVEAKLSILLYVSNEAPR